MIDEMIWRQIKVPWKTLAFGRPILSSNPVNSLLCSLIYRVNGFWEAVVQKGGGEGQIPPVLTPVDILWDEEMLFRPSDSFQSSQKHSFSAAQGLLYKNNKQLLQRHVIASHNSREINDIIIWTAAMGNND